MSVCSKSYTSEEVHSTTIGHWLAQNPPNEVLGLLGFRIIPFQVRNIISVREGRRADLVSCASSGPPTKKWAVQTYLCICALGPWHQAIETSVTQ